MPSYHTTRDSLFGFDRSKLRKHIESHMGLTSNADIFASKGDTWQTTESDERRQAVIRAKLEQHLREADKSFETVKDGKKIEVTPTPKQRRHLETFILSKLADAGLSEPVRYDKQKLAQENKARRNRTDTRQSHNTSMKALRQRVNRLANLEQERKLGAKVDAVTSDKRKEYGHFVMERA